MTARGRLFPAMSAEARQAAVLAVTVWSISSVLFLLPTYLSTGRVSSRTLEHLGILYTAGLALSAPIHFAAVALRHRAPFTKLLGMLVAAALASVALGLADYTARVALYYKSTDGLSAIQASVTNMVGFLWLYGLIAAILTVLQSNRTMRERDAQLAEAREQAVRAEAEASAASLAALRYQLNPHLLFNALNSASSLVVTHRNDDAEAMLARLSEFLRTTLVTDPASSVRLAQELDTIENYLAIEAIRFGDRLAVKVDCPGEVEDALVPSFLLQPLVENAVKYAVAPARGTVSLAIAAQREGDSLLVTVTDSGAGEAAVPAAPGTGTGLANVRRRLAVLHGEEARLATEVLAPGYRATVTLPLTFASETVEAHA